MQYPPNQSQQPNTYYPPQQWQQPPMIPPPRPPKKQNPWLILAIVTGCILVVGMIADVAFQRMKEYQATPELKTIRTWNGTGTEKTDAFAMDGTWHIQWSCSGQSGWNLTINLINFDTGMTLKSWQNACVTDQFDEVVNFTGIFVIEGNIGDPTATYHIAVLK